MYCADGPFFAVGPDRFTYGLYSFYEAAVELLPQTPPRCALSCCTLADCAFSCVFCVEHCVCDR